MMETTTLKAWTLAALLVLAGGCAGESTVEPGESGRTGGEHDPIAPDGDDDDNDDDDDDDGDDDGDDDDDYRFLRPAAGAPSLAQTTVSFWAVRGETRSASIWYHAQPGASDSTEFVRFAVDSESLVEHPNGTPVAVGDSVLITFTVVDPTNLIVDFQPQGLRFAAAAPAKLTFGYAEADPDLDFDGEVDDDDAELEATLGIGRQETAPDPFQPIPSQADPLADQVRTDIDGFTRYAVMY